MTALTPLLILLVCSPAPIRGAEPPDPISSCVWVRAENDSAVAGCVVDAEKRLLVTCRHVVADREKVDVFFPWHRDGELVAEKRDYLGNRQQLRDLGLLLTGKVVR